MSIRALLPPLLVALCVSGLTAWAVKGPLDLRLEAPGADVPDDLDRVVAEIDAEFRGRWQANGLTPAPVVEDELLILRRLSLALHGTIPSLEEIRAFQADDRPERLRHWTAAMLEDTRFADYFAERLARTFVGVDEGQFIVFRRDRFGEWLSQQLREHRPYDEIARQMITAQGVWTGDPETNFLTAAFANDQFDHNELAGRTVRAFLGQRIDCAQCHDHPFSHWKQAGFEGLAAHFGELQISLVGIEDKAGPVFQMPAGRGGQLRPGPLPAELRDALNRHKLQVPENAELQQAGGGTPQWVVFVPPSEESDDARLDVRAVVRIEGGTIRVYRPASEHIIDEQAGENVRVAMPAVPFGAEWLPEQGTRRERLAAWVTHPENRRFERAIANRVWGLMFGRPFHSAVDDLPDPDDPATSEELRVLDLLGADFRAHGCDLRRLVKVIAASTPFRLASRHPQQALLENPEELAEAELRAAMQNVELLEHHWAVFPLVRLRPEQMIGAMLQANHLTTIDRNSHLFVRAQRFFRERDFVREFGDPGEAELEQRVGTIPQALLRMNGQFSRELTEAGPFNAAGRISGIASSPAECVDVAYLVCLTRPPTPPEREHFTRQLQDAKGARKQAAMQDLYWTLFNSAEFSWNH